MKMKKLLILKTIRSWSWVHDKLWWSLKASIWN